MKEIKGKVSKLRITNISVVKITVPAHSPAPGFRTLCGWRKGKVGGSGPEFDKSLRRL